MLTDGSIYEFTNAVISSLAKLGADQYIFYGNINTDFQELINKYIPAQEQTLIPGEPTPITDYSAARNKMDLFARNDYVLHLDTDEVLIDFTPVKANVMFDRINYIYSYNRALCGEDWQLRYYNKNFFEWRGEVHERCVSNLRIPVIKSQVYIYHFSFMKPIPAQKKLHNFRHKLQNKPQNWEFGYNHITRPVPNIKQKLMDLGVW